MLVARGAHLARTMVAQGHPSLRMLLPEICTPAEAMRIADKHRPMNPMERLKLAQLLTKLVEFDVRGAVEEFQRKRAAFEPMEDATDAAYQELAKGLGQEWSELTWSDHLNRTWDRLGHAVCEIILSRRALLLQMPEDCRQQLVELARLGNSFARKCAEELGINVPEPYPDASARLKILFTLGGGKKVS